MAKILVTGATGNLGGLVVRNLLERTGAEDIAVLVRDPEKAAELKDKGVTIVTGDYNDYESLIAAFQNVDKLYFVSSSDVPNRYPQHQNVVKAAIDAKVGHIIYTSAQRKSEDGTSPIALVADAHWKTDNLIKESGLTYTILKHGLYTDILPMFMGSNVIETGTIFLPAGEGKSSYASRADMAEAGAILLTSEGHENKIYELGGTTAHSFYDIAEILTSLSGKTIQYVSPSAEDYSTQLKGYGLPEEAIQGAATFCVAIAEGEFNFPSQDLKDILGRAPETVEEFLRKAYQL